MDRRPSPIAGSWYPGSPEALALSVDAQLEKAPPIELPGHLVAIIVPHAGHRYSGHIAAQAFRMLKDSRPEIVAVVSPLHQPYAVRVASTSHAAYETPLGIVPVDRPLLDRLASELEARAGVMLERIAHDQEHSLEIELPFLQRVLSEPFRLLPVMIRDQSHKTTEALGHALGALLGSQMAILVGSTDLSHFYPETIARSLDAEILKRLEAFDPAGVLAAESEGAGFACGKGAVAAILWAARDLGADRVRLLAYGTSGDITGDHDSVVGYGAAAVYRSSPDQGSVTPDAR